MKNSLTLILFFVGYALFGHVTIIVDEYPKEIKDQSIYISGDFENWSGGKEAFKLQKKDNYYFITIPKKEINMLFKFTLGSWKTAESSKDGSAIGNRTYTFKDTKDTIRLQIKGWSHLFAKQEKSTAAKNVFILSEEFFIPQLNRKRRIWLYLPPDYNSSKESYPVVYMHDGQNLFDKKTSFSGEWNVDETLNKLFKKNNLKLIVVGIDNGGDKRLAEYSPYKNEKYGGGEGDLYLDFITQTLKPYVDKNFRTQKDKSKTGIIGSSMGGLISHYAGLKYPNVFGKVGVFSPSFWFSGKIKEFTKQNANLNDTKMYFLAGDKEGVKDNSNEISSMVREMNSVVDIFKNNGFNQSNVASKVVKNGKHNEQFWSNNLEEAILWLFKDQIKPRAFVDASFKEHQLTLQVSDGRYKIHFYTNKIVETTFIPKGEKESEKPSHAVIKSAKFKNVKFTENEHQLFLETDQLSIKIHKKPFKISYWNNNELLTSESNGYQKTDDFETISLSITDDEVLYGGGARALGMNRRGNRLRLYNKADYGYETHSELMNFTMPLVVSSKKYMIHFDNAPIGFLDLDSNQDNTITYETISGRKTYQIIAGSSWENLIDNYTNLTGKQPLPPRWVFGNFSSRFGYHSQKETEETIQKFKEENIPVDAVILDLYWFGKGIKGTMGNLEVYKDSFPDMKNMVSKLKNKGVKTVLITEPFVVNTSKKWKEAVAENILAKDTLNKPATYPFYFGNTGIIDIYKKDGRDWFWNVYKDILNLGVKGLWGDLGEPEVLPSWVSFGENNQLKADEIHNIYGHNWAELIHKGYQKNFPNERPFILVRAGYSGSQRFGMIPWSGDVNRTWGGLQSQPEISLQMGMQGLGYMHSDLGGFAGANLDDNLYIRWLQYGVFQPIYRPHAQEDVASEPVFRSDFAKKHAKKAIELRYKMLPYNYNLASENHQKGLPLMRPIFFEENSKELSAISSTYLWGKDFLVTPILKDSVKATEVIFPKNANWFNFYFDEKIEGGQTKKVKVKQKAIPTYVRGGVVIPMTKLVQTTDDYTGDNLELHYWFDSSVSESERVMYNDDGLTANAFEKGQYELLEFEVELEKKYIEIDFEAEFGKNWTPSKKEITLILHNIKWKPKKIKVDGKRMRISSKNYQLKIPVKWNPRKEMKIKISLN